MRMKIKRGSRVSTDAKGFIGVVVSCNGETVTAKDEDGKLTKVKASLCKLTRGRVPGKDYSKAKRKAKKATKVKAKSKPAAKKAKTAAKPKRSHKAKPKAAPIVETTTTNETAPAETASA